MMTGQTLQKKTSTSKEEKKLWGILMKSLWMVLFTCWREVFLGPVLRVSILPAEINLSKHETNVTYLLNAGIHFWIQSHNPTFSLMVLLFYEILVRIQEGGFQSVAVHGGCTSDQGSFRSGYLRPQDSDVIGLRCSPSIGSFKNRGWELLLY